ncbi:MAG: gamma-glutamylcyclotransferase [Gammaproteobacteria bacterium]|jgi:gamma-glutamylcyclotransferase (GGCT)/AIG2-like uncharacterized protein YtfP|nr:gamma-glutamylcyclotransferase [Gammaproteobacteria bacterium]
MNLFTYGTLMDPDIMAQVSGAKHRSQKAVLQEHVRKTVIGEVYPAIIMREGCSVEGAIYYDVSSVSFERLDKFEGSLYLRAEVPVICDDGVSVAAETYVITASAVHQLSAEDWSYDRFLSKDKVLFQGAYPGYDELV